MTELNNNVLRRSSLGNLWDNTTKYNICVTREDRKSIVQEKNNIWRIVTENLTNLAKDKLWYTHSMESYLAVKETNRWYMGQHGWISEASCWVKEMNLQMVQTVWFHLYDNLQQA